jgi:hypothetical protein
MSRVIKGLKAVRRLRRNIGLNTLLAITDVRIIFLKRGQNAAAMEKLQNNIMHICCAPLLNFLTLQAQFFVTV